MDKNRIWKLKKQMRIYSFEYFIKLIEGNMLHQVVYEENAPFWHELILDPTVSPFFVQRLCECMVFHKTLLTNKIKFQYNIF